MKKSWRNIPDSPGYKVSNDGHIKSCINNRYGLGGSWHEIVPCTDKLGYKKVHLGRNKRSGVHRLVAEAFIPNPENYPVVRHLDDNPGNNRVSNLAWGTQKDNMQDCVNHGRLVGDTKAAVDATKTKVVATHVSGDDCYIFNSCAEASRVLGVITQSISKVMNGQMKKSHDYTFRRYQGSEDAIWKK